ncbi:conserved hypothetical protein [Nitrobacter winogradskyi Nb-255]|uniref:Uncharacterized protein n=1 Tax=Nitrobacter winogradskyi (strain ATCC 25391 / DSM 10237 / CIP 104748 / NCIMB 11846 / Nb-255) TaxID=323098 RepID=Q3SPG3_NITWN|nr:hypothetical protein [Nitrobacter winogradskyi]ABA05828.1 conserved hypothetical protein [Nitrobacter winogradskyi Nb-255]
MRALGLCLISLMIVLPATPRAQDRPLPRTTPGGAEVRYFTSIDGLMEGNADVILKETRHGKTVTSAVLDVCYPAEKGSDRKDRFVANLAVNGSTLTGSTQSIGDKLPVTVKLTRKPTGDTFEFDGRISVGERVTEVTSTDNSDLSEAEFNDVRTTDDGIIASPRDFTEVSPEAIAVKVKIDAATDLLKGLRGQNLRVLLNSLEVTCEALRAGAQVIDINIDPERAPALVARMKATPGVIAAGWSAGMFDMERTIRFPAAEWRDKGKLNRDKLAAAISGVLEKSLDAKPVSAKWSEDTGKLTLTFKRPSTLAPALGLTDTIEVTALPGPDRPEGSDHIMLWVGAPSTTTADESDGPRLGLADDLSTGDGESIEANDRGAMDALAKQFKAQRWDVDASAWK